MPAWLFPAVLSGISAAAGALGGRKRQAQAESRQEQASKTEQISQYASSVLPQYLPEDLAAKNIALAYLRNRLAGPDLSGYMTQGIRNINQAAAARANMIRNALAARGLGYSPMATIVPALTESAKLSDIANFINQLPLLQWQLQGESLKDLASFIASLPVGQTSTGSQAATATSNVSSHGITNEIIPGNVLGGLLSGLGQGLASTWGYSWTQNQLRRRNNIDVASVLNALTLMGLI